MKQSNQRKILVTSALPYANGDIHLGHLLEYIQTDIWVRFQKLMGHQCNYVCADDTHGTAIMLRAEQEGLTPEQLISQVHTEHTKDFSAFHVCFDHYHSTHSEESRILSEEIFAAVKKAGFITEKTISQLYDNEKGLFLADRFVKGTCPRCKAEDQYGDNCEQCGATYNAQELINPRSVYSGTEPVVKDSVHLFFELPAFTEFLQNWTTSGSLQPQVANKLSEWLDSGLQAWDISRDAPYFGFAIPGYTDKYFYVWLDAPIGYMASFKALCDTAAGKEKSLTFADYWQADSNYELYHFIGKDIINFHCLFWPALLEASGYRSPSAVFAHGFLTVDGQKMSKSRGTFILAKTYLEHLNPEYLRYYFAAKLNANVDDLDLNLDDFVQRVNSDIVGKVVNIASRCAGFINKRFAGELSEIDPSAKALIEQCQQQQLTITKAYEQREFSRAMRDIMSVADLANQYIDQHKPWILAKDPEQLPMVQLVCTTGINLFRLLVIYLKPVLPKLAEDAEQFLNCQPLTFIDSQSLLERHTINRFKPLMTRIEAKQVEAMKGASQSLQEVAEGDTEKTSMEPPIAPEIEYDDFAKLDFRVARIVKAEAVPKANKLVKLSLDLGGETRQVFAGIKAAYQPEQLEGRLTVMVANLKPRKMRFGMSEGMVLAAGPGGEDIFLLNPDEGAKVGMKVT